MAGLSPEEGFSPPTALVPGIDAFGMENLVQVVQLLSAAETISPCRYRLEM